MSNYPIIGLNYFINGFSLIAKPGIKRFVIIPLIINIFLFIAFFFLLSHFVKEFNAWFLDLLPSWLAWMSVLLWLLFFISFFLIFVYTFVTLANLISAPFNSLLAEKVELYIMGTVPEPRSLLENIKDIPRIIGRQLMIVGYYLPRAFLLFILFFIPVIQTIAPIAWFLFHAHYLTLTYIDYPTDNNRVAMQNVKNWLSERRLLSLGFGSGVLIASMIPIINFFTIPAAVAGATKFWLEQRFNKNECIIVEK